MARSGQVHENTPYPLEAAFFDFCPTEFFDEIYKIIDGYIREGVDELEETLLMETDKSDHEMARIYCDKVMNKYQQAFDSNLDKFELYAIMNIFKVKPETFQAWCAQKRAQKGLDEITELSIVNGESDQITEFDYNQIQKKVVDERRKLRRETRRNVLLSAKLESLRSARIVICGEIQKAVQIVQSARSKNGDTALGLPEDFAKSYESLVAKSKKIETLIASAKELIQRVELEGGDDREPLRGAANEAHQVEEQEEHEDEATTISMSINEARALKRTMPSTTDDMRKLAARI